MEKKSICNVETTAGRIIAGKYSNKRVVERSKNIVDVPGADVWQKYRTLHAIAFTISHGLCDIFVGNAQIQMPETFIMQLFNVG